MPVTDIIKDLDNLSITITAEFAARRSASGRSTPIRASSSGSGVRRHTPPPWSTTRSRPAVG